MVSCSSITSRPDCSKNRLVSKMGMIRMNAPNSANSTLSRQRLGRKIRERHDGATGAFGFTEMTAEDTRSSWWAGQR